MSPFDTPFIGYFCFRILITIFLETSPLSLSGVGSRDFSGIRAAAADTPLPARAREAADAGHWPVQGPSPSLASSVIT
jgi:hypothetical protein